MIPKFLKPIPGYYGDYLVTEFGKVWSNLSNKFLTPYDNGDGYLRTRLGRENTEQVHRLVAKAWIPNPDKLPVVHHKDGNRQNNHVSNLTWCTQQENVKWGGRNHG